MTGILLALQGGLQTADRLAVRFEVSRRTILRDVDALSQLGVPIVALPGPGGGYSLPDGYWLAPLQLTAEEATVLLLAIQALPSGPDAPMGRARASAEEKVRAALRPRIRDEADNELETLRYLPAHRQPVAGHVEALRRAAGRRGWVRVRYRSLHRDAEHELLPLRLWLSDGRWYCAAISRAARAERVFRPERMESVESMPPPSDAGAVIRAASAPRTAYADPGHPEVHVTLIGRAILLAEDHPDFASRMVSRADGRADLRFRCPPEELPYYAAEILRFDRAAVVHGPHELVELVRSRARALADHHDATADGDRPVSPIAEHAVDHERRST